MRLIRATYHGIKVREVAQLTDVAVSGRPGFWRVSVTTPEGDHTAAEVRYKRLAELYAERVRTAWERRADAVLCADTDATPATRKAARDARDGTPVGEPPIRVYGLYL